jgi:hypothetical protein
MHSRPPLPKTYLVAICLIGFLGMLVQLAYSFQKGFVYWGHPGGGVGPMMFGQPYNKVYRDKDPRKFWLLFYFQAFLGIIFLVGLIAVSLYYNA